ncbi:MAG: glutamate ligase domain-containing protein, partial [Paracoccaceae bacterium]
LVERLGGRPGVAVWLDGGHNPAAGAALAAHIGAHARAEGGRLHLIAGKLETTEAADYASPFASLVGCVRPLAIPGSPAPLPAEARAGRSRAPGLAPVPAASPDAAAAAVAAATEPGDRVLIGGSQYLAGVVLAENG